VTYYDAINEDLKVLHCSDQNCAPLGDSITSPDSVGSQGYTSSVALDAAGNPVVSYYGDGPSDGHLKVLHCDDPNCSSGGEIITVPDTAQDVGYNSSIVLDASGNPVISYYANIGQDLKLLHCDDPDCAPGGDSITSPDTGDGVGQYTSLKLDSSGNPVVSYWDFINNDLKVLHCDDPACAPGGDSITTPDAGVVGYTGSLMLDGEGNPVISYNGNGEIKLLHCDDPYCAPGGNSFTTPGLGFNSSMVLDAAGNPVLRYSDGEDLKVMHCDDPGCASGGDSVTAPANDNGGYLGSFALDGYGNPVASYYGAGLDLKILHCDNPACGGGQATTPTGTSVAVGLGTDVTVTFGQVTSPGMTVANLETVPAAPGGFTFGSPPAQYQIATTAAYTGSIQVCIDYYDESFAPEMEAGLLLMHYEAGNWLDVTTSLDTVNNFICGESNSLSPFGVMSLATGQDYDTDGCSNAAELGQNQLTGGLRDPLNPNDYFNPSHDGKNRVDDILLTVQAYFDDDNDGTPGLPPYAAGYNPDTDRTLVGPSAWNLGPPNGLQRVDDILNQVKQYFHDCS